MERRFRAADRIVAIRVERRGDHLRLHTGSGVREVVVRRHEGCLLELVVDGRPLRALVARDGRRRIFVKVGRSDPEAFELETRPPGGVAARAGNAAPAPGDDLVATMDGRVVDVRVREGDLVEAGATLVVLEAMKMELRLTAPHAGTVRALHCRPGEVVERGRRLVILEPVPGGEAVRGRSAGQLPGSPPAAPAASPARRARTRT
ncbi:MAG: acetyl-CoA carboxylase biotin carboxyl carrier protein subunit [Candidatus Polarisedimenticolia bacterium]